MRGLTDSGILRDTPPPRIDVVLQVPHSRRSAVPGLSPGHPDDASGKPDGVITVTILDRDPSPLNESAGRRRPLSQIERRQREPRCHRLPGAPFGEQQAPHSDAVLTQHRLTPQDIDRPDHWDAEHDHHGHGVLDFMLGDVGAHQRQSVVDHAGHPYHEHQESTAADHHRASQEQAPIRRLRRPPPHRLPERLVEQVPPTATAVVVLPFHAPHLPRRCRSPARWESNPRPHHRPFVTVVAAAAPIRVLRWAPFTIPSATASRVDAPYGSRPVPGARVLSHDF